MLNLVIPALLRLLGGSLQGGIQVPLCDGLDILSRRQSPRLETGAIVLAEPLRIGDEPGFHHLDDEVALVGCRFTWFPAIPVSEMIPGLEGNGGFGVDKQNVPSVRMSAECGLELVECDPAWATSDDLPTNPPLSRDRPQGAQKSRESRSYRRPRIAPFSASLHIDPDLSHHRLPPISPIRQTSPSLNSPSQCARLGDSRRRSRVPAGTFSHTTTASGVAERPETRVSEWDVTIN